MNELKEILATYTIGTRFFQKPREKKLAQEQLNAVLPLSDKEKDAIVYSEPIERAFGGSSGFPCSNTAFVFAGGSRNITPARKTGSTLLDGCLVQFSATARWTGGSKTKTCWFYTPELVKKISLISI